MHFDLIDLRLYLHILDTGNITAGASRSHLSLAAASARIRAMEASLGIEFLERGRRGVTPTAAGKALARHARLLLQQADHLQQDLAEYANGVKGQVRLLCNTTALSEYLPELLADFLHEHPNLDIDLQELPSLRITHALRQGAADLGIISDAVDTHGLQTLPFRDDPLVLMNTTAMLEDLGHTVIDAMSGMEALEKLEGAGQVDLVITDHAMPSMTGSQLAQQIRARWPDLPVVLATGYAELPPGGNDALPRLSKPFSQAELAKIVESSVRPAS